MIKAENFYVVRTPLLPVNTTGSLAHPHLVEHIRQILQTPFLREAIYIASPELFGELEKWEQGSQDDKLVYSLYRYLLRMSSRCTPYGLFAGCATGAVSEQSGIRLHHYAQHVKQSRLDMNYVAELVTAFTAIPAVREQLRFYPNSSLYQSGSRYRYAAYQLSNKFRHYFLTAVNTSDYLDAVLAMAAHGTTLKDIRNCLVDEANGITAADADDFTEELLQSQLLVSELEPTVTGEQFFQRFVERAAALQQDGEWLPVLRRIQSLLQDQQSSIPEYRQVHTLVKSLMPDTSEKDLIQTDLFMATVQNTLSHTLLEDITTQVNQLRKLMRHRPHTDLENFCQAFSKRYEEQEIPLSLALDPEAGIGYGYHLGRHTDHTPLADDIVVAGAETPAPRPAGKLQLFQQQQLYRCLRENSTEILLTDADLDALQEKDTATLPYSMYLMGSILGASAAAVDAGHYLFELNGCAGPSAANLLGRFCHGDEQLAAQLKACLDREAAQEPDKIFAEVVHLPEARTGNVLLRPQLRDHEIVYLANSTAPADQQLPLSDLMISVQQGRIVLRSRKLNKIIVPRMSTAHNYRNGLPVYKFLCELQHQDYPGNLGWAWQLPGGETFLPRVRYRNIILSKCSWTLDKKDFPDLDSGKSCLAIFQPFKTKWQLPSHVVIVEGDNELLIDTTQEASLHLLFRQLRKSGTLTVQEFLSTAENCWIEGPDGRHTNQFIIPVHDTGPVQKPATTTATNPATATLPRQFMPGSEWLYVKVYCGTRTAEDLLKETLQPLALQLTEAALIDKWFFIRYTDPDHHLRIRFHHSSRPDFWKTVLERFYAALQEFSGKELVYRIQTDTYERETERYGDATMEFSESLFWCDSEAVVQTVALLDEEQGEDYRWQLALRGTDMLIQDFGYTPEEKPAFMEKLQQGFFREHGGEKALLLQLNDKYRKEMRKVQSILNPHDDEHNGIGEAVAFFRQRSEKIRCLLQQYGPLPDKAALLPSYIHMFLNRLFLANQRKQELVLYHFLSKYYASQAAIRKQQTPSGAIQHKKTIQYEKEK
ncbi:thiopeptide-type bacteriocin biosynthesis domain-containing protein [Chitinophaga eiseniae]|uniref:Thiopeptide-type bacteriocin biosynthesis domain-containing protein n=1 Tax=Chitinophaga eiseniae TaxID=634771 RepID=A0A1T4ST33_9BACT|nr:lantibiotic dehydratase [Chitinophaga eiseniae]SKA31038.1 thiopeptide-type bacteriocin biosynthesis domain-containing protein [Chitinophaga eiseniae]